MIIQLYFVKAWAGVVCAVVCGSQCFKKVIEKLEWLQSWTIKMMKWFWGQVIQGKVESTLSTFSFEKMRLSGDMTATIKKRENNYSLLLQDKTWSSGFKLQERRFWVNLRGKKCLLDYQNSRTVEKNCPGRYRISNWRLDRNGFGIMYPPFVQGLGLDDVGGHF